MQKTHTYAKRTHTLEKRLASKLLHCKVEEYTAPYQPTVKRKHKLYESKQLKGMQISQESKERKL